MIINGIKLAFGFFIAKVLWGLFVVAGVAAMLLVVFGICMGRDWWSRRKTRRKGKAKR
jgi:hypothetical protein